MLTDFSLSTFLNVFIDKKVNGTNSNWNCTKNNCTNERVLFYADDYFMQLCRKMGENGEFDHYELIVADNSDGKKKRMAVLTAESVDSELVEMDCSGMRENMIIDLNEEGRRWEGGELNGKPFGFGYEYSEDGNLVYEGFVFEGMKVCVGKDFSDDGNNNCLMYEGGYCNDERWGKGTSYDLDGNVDFEGEWENNHILTENENENDLIVPMSIAKINIGKEKYSDENITTLHFPPLLARLKQIKICYHNFCYCSTLSIDHLPSLEKMEIGMFCFRHVRDFILDGLPNLESVKIGDESFGFLYHGKVENGLCRITNCPSLREFKAGRGCFGDYKDFDISHVDSLQSLLFEVNSFMCADLLLKGKWSGGGYMIILRSSFVRNGRF